MHCASSVGTGEVTEGEFRKVSFTAVENIGVVYRCGRSHGEGRGEVAIPGIDSWVGK